jgi:hypothetical protein
MTYAAYTTTCEQTEIYYAVMTPKGYYRYICDGWPMRLPTSATLYDAPEDVARFNAYVDTGAGDVIEPVVFTHDCYAYRVLRQ